MAVVIVVQQLCKILAMVYDICTSFDRIFSLGTGTEPVNDGQSSSFIVNMRLWTTSVT